MEEAKILIVEDDEYRAGARERKLRETWPHVQPEVVKTELELTRSFDALAKAGFHLVVLDQLLPYTTIDDAPTDRAPDYYTPFDSGSRCYHLLREDRRTAKIPIIFHTIVPPENVPDGAIHGKKSGDFQMTELMEKVGSQLKLARES